MIEKKAQSLRDILVKYNLGGEELDDFTDFLKEYQSLSDEVMEFVEGLDWEIGKDDEETYRYTPETLDRIEQAIIEWRAKHPVVESDQSGYIRRSDDIDDFLI